MSDCIFCKIIAKQIPAQIVYEDDDILAFNDIHPKAPVHLLVIPKLHIESMRALTEEDGGLIAKMVLKSNELAIKNGLSDGYKLHVNTGLKGGQEVFHWHIHIYGNKF